MIYMYTSKQKVILLKRNYYKIVVYCWLKLIDVMQSKKMCKKWKYKIWSIKRVDPSLALSCKPSSQNLIERAPQKYQELKNKHKNLDIEKTKCVYIFKINQFL